MTQFGISLGVVINIKKNAEVIIDIAASTEISLQVKTIRQPQFQRIDTEVLQVVAMTRALKFSEPRATITQRALLVKDKLVEVDENESYKSFAIS